MCQLYDRFGVKNSPLIPFFSAIVRGYFHVTSPNPSEEAQLFERDSSCVRLNIVRVGAHLIGHFRKIITQ